MTKSALRKRQDKWIAALVSDNYNQAQEVLCIREGNKYSYCCLGLAKRICNLDESDYAVLSSSYSKLGLHNSSGGIDGVDKLESLTQLNDVKKYTLPEIGKFIIDNPLKVFTNVEDWSKPKAKKSKTKKKASKKRTKK